MERFKLLVLIFFIYSFIGWIVEIINCYGWYKKIVNRGFLIGPYCPIYGCGSVLMTLIIPGNNDLLSVFLKAMAICSILEYVTSWLMEKLFKTRWWDYSKKKFNLNGRICLETMVLFGIGGVAIINFINPIILKVISMIPNIILNIILIIISIIFIIDVIVSYNIISHFKKAPRTLKKDSTEEVTKLVRQTLKENSVLDKRLVNSFPNLQVIVKKYDKRIEKQKKKIKKDYDKLKELKKKN